MVELGVKVHRPGMGFERTRELALAAERVGFDSVWGFDHLSPMDGRDCLEQYATLAALLPETADVRAGTLITSVGYRHPALVANMVATMDRISDGRIELGIGAGSAAHCGDDYRAYGMDLPDYDARMDRLEEACQVIRRLWQGDATFDGEFYSLADAGTGVPPVQDPHPPLIVGGSSNRTVGIAGRHADELNLSTGPGGDHDELIDAFEGLGRRADEFCERIGRDPASLRRSVQVFVPFDEGWESRTGRTVTALRDAGADRLVLAPPAGTTTDDLRRLYDVVA